MRGEVVNVSTALTLSGVSRRYGAIAAATSLDLTVAPGEMLTVIGPSGCGKSTMLRMIAGLERPDSGTITIAGDVVADRRNFQEPERRRVGLVFQDHALFPNLTVAKNVAFGLNRLSLPERRKRVAEVLELVRLDHLAARYPHELSGGEQQRVAVARALAPRPAVVLLDEPFSSLDETLRGRVRADIVAVLKETGTTSLLVTHDQTEALSVGDRVVVMHDGVIEQADTPEKVFEQPATRFVASFMGDADFLPANVHNALLTCEIGVVSTVPGWANCDVDVDVVLRPHEVALAPDPGASARVVSLEYRGAFVLHYVRLASGRTLRSWQPHHVRYAPGTAVTVTVASGTSPTLLVDDRAVTEPPIGIAGHALQAPEPFPIPTSR
ncbi:ABC transporter ATP-binding protein [Arthrobacter parietis]|uniref:ABC transporter ATP-binding protein n=2 Tax=Arthrobacter TaxID=1663 RepID=A0ABT6CVY2_9MICC|nr:MULTISPECIES: ABC transporter ATP-binding protein [Arthrobacter]KRF08368.1 ABC transporter [Arthrobacter sp. Soil782]MDF9278239.1 ABC transporter ATP-binding protein [Arthrobacter vasquezii]